MRRRYRSVLLAGLIALMPVLAGCGSLDNFDMDSLDFFHLNDKKKLPGERKELFPGGVPGVTQGIPPEYLKGNQQQADTALAPGAAAAPPPAGANPPPAQTAAIAPAEEPKVKPKPKHKPKPAAAKPPTRVTVQPAPQGQGSGEQKLEPWPGTAPQQQPAPAQSNDPWLSAPPPPSTMSR